MAFRTFKRDYSFTDDHGDVRVIPNGWTGELSDAVAKAADDAGVTDQSKAATPASSEVEPAPRPMAEVGMGKPPEPLVQENPVIMPGGRVVAPAPAVTSTTAQPGSTTTKK